jgi:two-component system, OmpR family, response regulator CpxR
MSHTVLVVEDDVDIRQALVEILEDQGFETLGARDGADALDILSRATDLPCVILLDLMMPVMDGAAFREAQRNDPRIASIPVVVLSAYRDVERHAAPLDAVSVLRKPPTVRELVTVLRAHC